MSAAVVKVGYRHIGPLFVVQLGDAVAAGGRAVAERAAPQPHDDGPVAGQLVGKDSREEAAPTVRQLAQQPRVVRHPRTRALATLLPGLVVPPRGVQHPAYAVIGPLGR